MDESNTSGHAFNSKNASIKRDVFILKLKQMIGGCYDVFNLRAGLHLWQRQGIDQNSSVGNQLGRLFELGQSRTRSDAQLKNPARLQLDGRQ